MKAALSAYCPRPTNWRFSPLSSDLYYNVWMTLLLRHVRLAAEKNGAPADILLSGGKISAIGDLPPRADFIFEGEGAFASPGFIDVHAAADHSFALLQHPAQTDTLAQGITSALIGQKGFSLAPLPERPAG